MLGMLEPLVRPDGRGPASAVSRQRAEEPAPDRPIERASFEQLLEQLRATGQAAEPQIQAPSGSAPADEPTGTEQGPVRGPEAASSPPLDDLGRVDRIDNPALLGMLDRRGEGREG